MALQNDQYGNWAKQECASSNQDCSGMLVVGVKAGEVHRPKHLANVAHAMGAFSSRTRKGTSARCDMEPDVLCPYTVRSMTAAVIPTSGSFSLSKRMIPEVRRSGQ